MVGRAVDEDDAVPAGEFAAQMMGGHQPAGAAAEDDDVRSPLPACAPGHRAEAGLRARLHFGRLLEELLNGGGEALLFKLALPQNHLAVRPDE